jgi:hypothetical protein
MRLAIAQLALLAALPLFAAPKPDLVLWDCESTKGVEGLELSKDLHKVGDASVRWRNHTKTSGIRVDDIPHDWSGYHVLRLWLHNAKAGRARIMLLIHSENQATEGMDYWGHGISLNFTGWRQFSFPIGTAQGGSRSPRGWDQIDGISFTASGWGNTPQADSDVYIDDIRLIDDPPRPGPLMTDQQFFAELDLTRPNLAAVKRAVDANDIPAAKAAVLRHFRDRQTPKWHFDWRDRPTNLPPLKSGTDGWDYYGTGFTVDWVGWKEFTFPFAEWKASREPQGWHYITSLRFSATYGERTPKPDTYLAFDDMRFDGEKSLVLGEFETDEDFARWPDFAPVTIAGCSGKTAGGWQVARKADVTARDLPVDWRPYTALRFRVYSAKATGDRITLVADSDIRNVEKANRLLKHIYNGYFLGDDIDWKSNNRKPDDPAYTREWTYALNRFWHWRTLGQAYWQTGDEKYARGWIDEMRDWVEDNPYPRFTTGNRSFTWRTIEAGIRTSTTWPDSLMYFLGSPSLQPDDLVMFLKSWIEHAHHLMRITVEYPEHGGNWVTMECNGLGHLGVLLPECKNAPLWLKIASDRLSLELDRQVYPDGAQKELTTGYHQVSLSNFVALYKFAAMNGTPLADSYLAKLQRMYEYDLKAMDPAGRLPPLNDAWRTNVRDILQEGYDLFGKEDFLWAATQGRKGTKPAFASIAMPYAGQYVMRSGWEPDAYFSLFESGPYGIGHQHEDKLSLFIHALGRELLTEAGTYRYDGSKYRRYALSTWAHNTILVDGQNQHRGGLRDTYETDRPLDNLWLHNDLFDAADGIYQSGYGRKREIKVQHERTVVFLHNDYWLVLDRVHGDGKHKLDILWNLKAKAAETLPGSLAAHGTDPDVPNLLVTPTAIPGLKLDIVTGRDDPPLGFSPAKNKTPVPCLDYQLPITGATALAWVLTPYQGTPPDVAITSQATNTGTILTVTHPKGTDRVFIAKRGTTGKATLAGNELTGRIAVVRQAKDGTIRSHAE